VSDGYRYAQPILHTEDIEDDVRLTYVAAITRATHEAFITYSNMSELVGRLVV
jgi:superfamily I DNA/RNA helicase